MANVRRLVLDVLKPHDPSLLSLSKQVSEIESVESVNTILVEVDEKVENVKLTIVGDSLVYDRIQDVVDDMGGSIHSVDEVVCGREVVEEVTTPQG